MGVIYQMVKKGFLHLLKIRNYPRQRTILKIPKNNLKFQKYVDVLDFSRGFHKLNFFSGCYLIGNILG